MSKVKDLMHAILNEGIEDEEEIVEEEKEELQENKVDQQPTFVEPKIKPVEDNTMIADFLLDKKKRNL